MTDEEYKASIQSKSTEELTEDLLGWIDGYFIDLAEATLRELERRVEEAQLLSELRSKVDGGKTMYDELVKVLLETDFSYGCPCGAEPLCKDKDCVIIQAADAIEELMRRCEQFQYMPLPAWIPVTERLPEHEYGESTSVLTVDLFGEMRVAYFDGGNWCLPSGEALTTMRVAPITHWMPLPEPPKGERKDDD